MSELTDPEKLLESWREHYETEGFSHEQAVRMAEISAGPSVVAVVRRARGEELDLARAFREHFEAEGEPLAKAEAMGAIASGDLRPSPRTSGGDIIKLVEGEK
jgi:hypothetical protein